MDHLDRRRREETTRSVGALEFSRRSAPNRRHSHNWHDRASRASSTAKHIGTSRPIAGEGAGLRPGSRRGVTRRRHDRPPATRVSAAAAELAVAGVAEAGDDEGLLVEVRRRSQRCRCQIDSPASSSAWIPSGAASAHTTVIGSGAPRSSSSSIVAISEPPVASIGSTTITGRPATTPAAC